MSFVCVQPMQTSWARRSEDLTFDKTDDKDAVLIARLTAQLRCYAPEPVDETWGRLRHLGARREELIVANVAQVQQIRDLLECVWPAALETAAAAVRVPDLGRGDERWSWTATAATWTAPVGWAGPGSNAQCAARSPTRGGQKPCLRIARNLFAALSRPGRGHRPPPWCLRAGRVGAGGLDRRPASAGRRPSAGWSRCSTSSSSPRW